MSEQPDDPTTRLDRFVLDVARERGGEDAEIVLVADDPTGALTRAALAGAGPAGAGRVLVCSRDVRQARRAERIALEVGRREDVRIAGIDGPLDLPGFLAAQLSTTDRAVLALTHLPKSLAELDHLARALASSVARDGAGAGLTLVGGGNTKHMTRTQNDVLARSFEEVGASRGQGKFRCLVARRPRPGVEPAPAATESGAAGTVHGIGGVFGGAATDRGGDVLVGFALADLRDAPHVRPDPGGEPAVVVDLGCGNGSVALAVLGAFPGVRVVATDVSADAVLSAELTLAPHAGRAEVTWDDAASSVPDASTDVVLLNPPFHEGTRIDATLVQPLLDAAARVLRPGGRLYLVHNSHLRYRPQLEARFARVEQVGRTPMFTVLRATVR